MGIDVAPDVIAVAGGWRAWALDPCATSTVVHGEVVAAVAAGRPVQPSERVAQV